MRKRDISGKTFGNLLALRIDEERHAVDKAKKRAVKSVESEYIIFASAYCAAKYCPSVARTW